jgi:glucokinase
MIETIGIDLGGTNIRGALWSEGVTLQHRIQRASLSDRPPAEILANIVSLIEELLDLAGGDVLAVGLGVPGIVDFETGTVRQSPHFPQWRDYPLRQQLQAHCRIPLYIDNDANYAALGESRWGANQETNNSLLLTLGTGVGGGIIMNGDVFRGDYGYAAEFGHVIVESEGPACKCGSHGCLEMFASATGLKQMVRDAPLDAEKQDFIQAVGKEPFQITTEDLLEAAQKNDRFANLLLAKCGHYLGIGMASIVHTLGIHTVAIGGGVSQAWDFFYAEMSAEFQRRSYSQTCKVTQLNRAKLGDDAGIIGAAYEAFRSFPRAS